MSHIAFVRYITQKFPDLGLKLRKASLPYSPEEFVKRTLISAAYVTTGLVFIFILFAIRLLPLLSIFLLSLVVAPLLMQATFLYFLQLPTVKINRIDREISKEIIYAGRFLVVELESGVTLYTAMKNIGKNFPVVGAYFREIIDKVNIGTSIEDAVSEAIELSPSAGLTKILWQISNSLRTGGDVSKPLITVIEILVKEQQIQMTEYARKLNPLAMFYMLIAVIVPTLGTTLLTIIAIFAGLSLDLPYLLIVTFLTGFVQFMFIAMISSIRPPVEL